MPGDAVLQPLLDELQKRHLLRALLGNTFWQVAVKLLRVSGNLVVGVWIARYLGPLDFGLLRISSNSRCAVSSGNASRRSLMMPL